MSSTAGSSRVVSPRQSGLGDVNIGTCSQSSTTDHRVFILDSLNGLVNLPKDEESANSSVPGPNSSLNSLNIMKQRMECWGEKGCNLIYKLYQLVLYIKAWVTA